MSKDIDDSELQTLLDLDGEVFPMDNGYWTKFEAIRVEPNKHIPHGVRYSLTLHDKYNARVIGFDNAHTVRKKKGRFRAKKTSWDHKHKREKISYYEFDSPSQLLEDFWQEVDIFLEEPRG